MIRDILLIFWRFHRIGFPSRYEAHAILAMLAVSVWHFCLVLAAAAACSGSCEDGETSLVQVGSWPVESLKYPKNEKRVRRSMKVMGFSFFSEFGNEMKMTRCEIQGANRHDLIFWCNSCHCPKQADQHSILSEKIWNDADHCAIYVCVCIYIYIQRTHTQTHIRVRPQLGRRSPSREVINPAFICISTRKRPTFCWWNVNCMAALVINLLRALPAKLALSGDTWSLKKK